MVTRKKTNLPGKKSDIDKKRCVCGSCDHPNPGLPGYLLISMGLVLLPVTMGYVPQADWVAKGWPLSVVLLGVTLVAKAASCSIHSK